MVEIYLEMQKRQLERPELGDTSRGFAWAGDERAQRSGRKPPLGSWRCISLVSGFRADYLTGCRDAQRRALPTIPPSRHPAFRVLALFALS